jgi:hypothetical protein
MIGNVTDEQLEAAMRAWARDSIETTTAPSFSPESAEQPADLAGARRGWLLPALAAAAVLVLVGAGLVVRNLDVGHTLGADALSTKDCLAQFRVEGVNVRPSNFSPHALQVTFDLRYLGTSPCVLSAYAPSVTVIGSDGADLGTSYDGSLVGYEPDHITVERGDRVRDAIEWTFLCPSSGPGRYEANIYLGQPTLNPPTGIRIRLGSITPPLCVKSAPINVGISTSGPPRIL